MIQPDERQGLARAREQVLGRIEAAARRAGRDPGSVSLVAVTKTVPPERVRAAISAGLEVLGENRVREAADKRPLAPGGTWHLVGPLQSNKAKRAIETFDVIESVDSTALASRLSRINVQLGREPLPVFLQVNVDADPAKAGFSPADLTADLAAILDLAGLRVDGLMTIGRLASEREAARSTFVALRALGERLRVIHGRLGPALSMGMSDDFEVAVEEGATLVRVGRALFGARP